MPARRYGRLLWSVLVIVSFGVIAWGGGLTSIEAPGPPVVSVESP